jgi:hypothetical protein
MTYANKTIDQKTDTVKDLTQIVGSIFPGNEEDVHVRTAQAAILLDDSQSKARLQPYNLLCIPTYGAAERARELDMVEKAVEPEIPNKKKERHRKRGKGEIEGEPVAEVHANLHTEPLAKAEKLYECDSALLAVIGILDALHHSGDVSAASFLRTSGLFEERDGEEAEHYTGARDGGGWWAAVKWIAGGRAALKELDLDVE